MDGGASILGVGGRDEALKSVPRRADGGRISQAGKYGTELARDHDGTENEWENKKRTP